MTRSVGFGPVAEDDWTDAYGFVYHNSPREKTAWIARRPFADEAGATTSRHAMPWPTGRCRPWC